MSDGAVVVIPARRASQRLPNKLLLAETGKPLLAHTVERVLRAQTLAPDAIARVLVAVDDAALADAAKAAGAEVIMTSPDCASGTDRVAQAVANDTCEVVINVQGDEAEIAPETVIAAARILNEDADADEDESDAPDAPPVTATLAALPLMGTLAAPLTDPAQLADPSIVKVVRNAAGDALYFSRAPIPYHRGADGGPRALHHLGIYAYRRAFLLNYKSLPASRLEAAERLEQLRALEAGYAIRVGLVDEAAPGIDTPEDYAAFVKRWKARQRD